MRIGGARDPRKRLPARWLHGSCKSCDETNDVSILVAPTRKKISRANKFLRAVLRGMDNEDKYSYLRYKRVFSQLFHRDGNLCRSDRRRRDII